MLISDNPLFVYINGAQALHCQAPSNKGLLDVGMLFFHVVMYTHNEDAPHDPIQAGAHITSADLKVGIPSWMGCHMAAELHS